MINWFIAFTVRFGMHAVSDDIYCYCMQLITWRVLKIRWKVMLSLELFSSVRSFQNRDQYSTNKLWGFTMDTNLFLTTQILRLGFEIRFLKFNEWRNPQISRLYFVGYYVSNTVNETILSITEQTILSRIDSKKWIWLVLGSVFYFTR